MNKQELLLAIDIGTTNTKVAVFDTDGSLRSVARRRIPLSHPRPDWSEVNVEDWWDVVCDLVPQALSEAEADPDQIRGIGLAGLMHALVPVTHGGDPIGPMILWFDRRSVPQHRWLVEEHGETLKRCLGSLPSLYGAAPMLRWLAENDPQRIARAKSFLCAKDFVRLRLTGEHAADVTDAEGTGLWDPRRGEWSQEALESVIGVPIAKFPPVLKSAANAGAVTEAAAARTGLVAGTPVCAGASDVGATLVGTNIYVDRRTCLYVGTAAWMMCAAAEEHDPLVPPDYVLVGNTATFGAAFHWFRGLLRDRTRRPSFTQLDEEAGRVGPGADGLLFFPHLMGERGNTPRADARGAFVGLTLGHSRGHVVRALYEGNAFFLRRQLDAKGRDVKELVIAGGCAESPLWRQIIADVTGRPILVPRVSEATALGAALLAAVGRGHFSSLEEAAAACVAITERVEPDLETQTQYELRYESFVKLEESTGMFSSSAYRRGI